MADLRAKVSGNRKLQRKLKPHQWRDVKLAMVQQSGVEASCSCGWSYSHPRRKVREDAIDRHFEKRHQGRGIRL
jgi:hypothetical protein